VHIIVYAHNVHVILKSAEGEHVEDIKNACNCTEIIDIVAKHSVSNFSILYL